MRKISEVFRMRFELKRSYRDIARSLNISISTVNDYLARGKTAGYSWPFPEGLSEETLYEKLFLPTVQIKNRPLPEWEHVHKELRKKGVTLRLLWREYRDTHPTGVGYTQFCHYYGDYKKTITPVMRQIHQAGEKCFVDYAGMKMPWIDVSTGELQEAEVFVGCLGASQYTFVEATKTQRLPDWISSHVNMFDFFGGVTEIVVPDNLKSGVSKAHRYDPDINANYQLLGEHYRVAIVPARAREPKDKGKVENAVGCVERIILASLRHCTFTSIAEINQAIQKRLTDFNSQLFQKMQTSRRELFELIDQPALKSLPAEKYAYAYWKKAKVHIDYHVTFDDHHYSVPCQYIHQPVEIRATSKLIECFYKGRRIAVHVRSYRQYGYSTIEEHMSASHKAYAKWTPERMKRWAEKTGPETLAFIDYMISARPFPQQAYRACLGVLRLGEKFGEARLEKACEKALKIGAKRYQQVHDILKNHLEDLPVQESESTQMSAHKNIRGPHYYQ
ncbi:IS21 family transposase [Legionella sp.]|uniref:IS21 family transposase n=1 Tax=Legionella sp. TaxID=459 RepID=UPI0039E574EE